MANICFIYVGVNYNFQSAKDDKMKVIFQKFISQNKLEKNSNYFLYNGKVIENEEQTFEEIANEDDKKRNEMKILVYNEEELRKTQIVNLPNAHGDNQKREEMNIIGDKINAEKIKPKEVINQIENKDDKKRNKNKNDILENKINEEDIKLKQFICPECHEISKIHIEDYKISIKCKNKHISNLTFVEYFEKISSSQLKANDKSFVCEAHESPCKSYCKKCKKNLCLSCENSHNSHEKLFVPNIYELERKNLELRKTIDKLKNDIKTILNSLNKVMENIEQYYNFINDVTNKYNEANLNHEILHNLNEIYNYDMQTDLIKIIEDTNIYNKTKNLLDIHEQMNGKKKNTIKIIYKVEDSDNEVKIFGKEFVENNKSFCKIINDGKEEELKEKLIVNNYQKDKKFLKIKLKGIKDITSAYLMFYNCSNLFSLPDIDKWDTTKVTNMRAMFSRCSLLSSLHDISKWDTSNVTTMKNMFSNCSSLELLPDISEWDISKVNDISHFFKNCSKLKSLPDISKWDTSQVIDMNAIFYDCLSLNSLPDISNWKTNKLTNMSEMFYKCSKLLSLPDISKWDTSSVINMSKTFYGCSSLTTLPDISKWDTSNIIENNEMLSRCSLNSKQTSKFLGKFKKKKKILDFSNKVLNATKISDASTINLLFLSYYFYKKFF